MHYLLELATHIFTSFQNTNIQFCPDVLSSSSTMLMSTILKWTCTSILQSCNMQKCARNNICYVCWYHEFCLCPRVLPQSVLRTFLVNSTSLEDTTLLAPVHFSHKILKIGHGRCMRFLFTWNSHYIALQWPIRFDSDSCRARFDSIRFVFCPGCADSIRFVKLYVTSRFDLIRGGGLSDSIRCMGFPHGSDSIRFDSCHCRWGTRFDSMRSQSATPGRTIQWDLSRVRLCNNWG